MVAPFVCTRCKNCTTTFNDCKSLVLHNICVHQQQQQQHRVEVVESNKTAAQFSKNDDDAASARKLKLKKTSRHHFSKKATQTSSNSSNISTITKNCRKDQFKCDKCTFSVNGRKCIDRYRKLAHLPARQAPHKSTKFSARFRTRTALKSRGKVHKRNDERGNVQRKS